MEQENKYLSKFSTTTLKFLKELDRNNNREWFEKNRHKYEENLLKPAQAFVEEMGIHLRKFSQNFNAIPKIDKSIFRIHRDVRFSKNKNPYKTNLGLLFWEGDGKKIESSGLYFHIEPKKFFIATGMYNFTKEQLTKYREVVSVEKKGTELKQILKKIETKGYKIGGAYYKRVPRGFDPEYKNAELLLYNGLYGFKEEKVSKLKNIDCVEFAITTFKELKPLHKWLLNNIY